MAIYAKLAWRNMRRSLRDYGIYFMTLVFAVAIFYVFNSIGDQPAFLSLGESTRRMAQTGINLIEWLTVIMSGVVALLVLYANRVIVRKRSRELGTYLLLGMEQGRLSLLLLAETTLISLAALGVGLAGGVGLSQLFAYVVDRVFGAPAQGHGFIFSPGGALRTTLYYGLMFVVVGLWQAAAIYRQRLIDLIHGARKNEEIRLRSTTLALAAGLSSALVLGGAYFLADRVSRDAWLDPTDPRVPLGLALGIAGTYLLFAALAGLLTGIRWRSGGWLARGVNLFLYRQVTSKINTHAGALATIALMLTFTICAMSTGLGLGTAIRAEAETEAPFAYMASSPDPDVDFSGLRSLLSAYGVADGQMVEFVTAVTDLWGADLMLPGDAERLKADDEIGFPAWVRVRAMSVSAYRSLRALKGYPDVPAAADGYLLHAAPSHHKAADAESRAAWERFVAAGSPVDLGGRALRPASVQVFTEPLGFQIAGVGALLIVPNEVLAGLTPDDEHPFQRHLVAEVPGPEPDGLTEAAWEWVWEQLKVTDGWISFSSRAETVGSGYLIEGILVFLSFYVGIMFILISATLLALQQLTDAVEHRHRFEVLRKLGADGPMIDGAIARQVGLYFLTPVAVALVHSAYALSCLDRVLRTQVGYDTVVWATLVTVGIFALVYGAYYLLTVASCRSLFRQQAA